MHAYKRNGCSFAVYRATGEDPGACEYHDRAQSLAPWFIESEFMHSIFASTYMPLCASASCSAASEGLGGLFVQVSFRRIILLVRKTRPLPNNTEIFACQF